MTLVVDAEPIPLAMGDDGVLRMTHTRVTLETVIGAFTNGATAEEIIQRYSTLALADVYVVLAYYLRHRADVDTYLAQQHERAQAVRQQNEQRFDPRGIRERLLARRPL